MTTGLTLTDCVDANIEALNRQPRLHKGMAVYCVPLEEMFVNPPSQRQHITFKARVSIHPRYNIRMIGELLGPVVSTDIGDLSNTQMWLDFYRRAKKSEKAVDFLQTMTPAMIMALRALTPQPCPRMPTQNLNKYLVPLYPYFDRHKRHQTMLVDVEPNTHVFHNSRMLLRAIANRGLGIPSLKMERSITPPSYGKLEPFFRSLGGGRLFVLCTQRDIALRWLKWSIELMAPYYISEIDRNYKLKLCPANGTIDFEYLRLLHLKDVFDHKHFEKNMGILYDFMSGALTRSASKFP